MGDRKLHLKLKKMYLQWTTSLHLSSIALSDIKGFSDRQVKYFPSSSIVGINVNILKETFPVSENWK